MKYFYYSRISSITQNSARQIFNFKEDGHLTSENVFLDKISGAVPFFERPQAQKLFEAVTPSLEPVTIVIDSIDRLGRNLSDIIRTIDVFEKNKINVRSIKENFETFTDGKKNEMASMTIAVMGSLSQMERNRLKERQAEGIKIAIAEGRYTGRKIGSLQTKEKLLQRHPLIIQKLQKGYTVREIVELTSSSSATVIKVKKALK